MNPSLAHDNPKRADEIVALRAQVGFSLLEMMVVLAIIGILMLAFIPANSGKIDQRYIAESLALLDGYKASIEHHYQVTQSFPANNEAAGMPEKNRIIGNYLASVELLDGALHLTLGNKVRPGLKGKILSVRPVFVPGTENAPVSWVCGYDTIPQNMVAAGDNLSDVPKASLPLTCR